MRRAWSLLLLALLALMPCLAPAAASSPSATPVPAASDNASAPRSAALAELPLKRTDTGLVMWPDGSLYSPEISAIKQRGVLIVSMLNVDQPPYFSEVNGELVGIDVDLARGLADGLNVRLEIDRSARTFNEVLQRLGEGKADLGISKLSRTLARTQFMAFSEPYVSLNQALLVNRVAFAKRQDGRSMGAVIRHYDGTMGVWARSSYASRVKSTFPHADVHYYSSWEEVIDALLTGKVEAVYRDEYEIKKVLSDDPAAALKLRMVTLDDLWDKFSVAVNLDAPALLNYVNLYLGMRGKPYDLDDLEKAKRR